MTTPPASIPALTRAGAACFCAGGLYGWSGLIPALERAFGATAAQSGLVFSLAIVAFTLAVLAGPRLFAPGQVAVPALIGAACLGAAGLAPGYTGFVIGFGIGFGLASGLIYIGVLALAAGAARPGVATALMVAAFGLGGAVYGPLWRSLVASGWGLSALWWLAAPLALIALTALATGRAQDRPAPGPADRHRLPGGLALVWLIFCAGSFAGLMILGLASKMIEASGGSAWLSGMVLAGIALGNTGGRLSVAGLSGRMQPVGMAAVATGLTGLGLGLAVAGGTTALAPALVIAASGYGMLASAIPVLTREIAGPERFGRAFAAVFTAWGLAGLTAPWVAGALFDRSGSFAPALWLALAMTGTALALALLARTGLGPDRKL